MIAVCGIGRPERPPEQGGDREPVGERSDHRRLGRRPDVADPGRAAVLRPAGDQVHDGGGDQQRGGERTSSGAGPAAGPARRAGSAGRVSSPHDSGQADQVRAAAGRCRRARATGTRPARAASYAQATSSGPATASSRRRCDAPGSCHPVTRPVDHPGRPVRAEHQVGPAGAG